MRFTMLPHVCHGRVGKLAAGKIALNLGLLLVRVLLAYMHLQVEPFDKLLPTNLAHRRFQALVFPQVTIEPGLCFELFLTFRTGEQENPSAGVWNDGSLEQRLTDLTCGHFRRVRVIVHTIVHRFSFIVIAGLGNQMFLFYRMTAIVVGTDGFSAARFVVQPYSLLIRSGLERSENSLFSIEFPRRTLPFTYLQQRLVNANTQGTELCELLQLLLAIGTNEARRQHLRLVHVNRCKGEINFRKVC